MILLDTDHMSVHAFPADRRFASLSARIRQSTDEFATTIVCLEEQLRGWLAAIKKKHDIQQQIHAYEHLKKLWEHYRVWNILPFDANAADQFVQLRK